MRLASPPIGKYFRKVSVVTYVVCVETEWIYETPEDLILRVQCGAARGSSAKLHVDSYDPNLFNISAASKNRHLLFITAVNGACNGIVTLNPKDMYTYEYDSAFDDITTNFMESELTLSKGAC
mmetsp:Transcript_22398/g.19111  ORF Transcript_22398/g.19111 Transcript_22398/m.19111 type:complete len:123 (-) Transcript_22398:16-384(-)